jgi:hypothetical protein
MRRISPSKARVDFGQRTCKEQWTGSLESSTIPWKCIDKDEQLRFLGAGFAKKSTGHESRRPNRDCAGDATHAGADYLGGSFVDGHAHSPYDTSQVATRYSLRTKLMRIFLVALAFCAVVGLSSGVSFSIYDNSSQCEGSNVSSQSAIGFSAMFRPI